MKRITTVAVLATATLCYSNGAASARDLSIVSWGGAYQEAQEKVYFDPLQGRYPGAVCDLL